MRKCDKRCIANVGGLCAVETCEGPILCLDWHLDDPQIAAELYRMVSTMFQKDFPEENEDKEE